MIQHDTFGEQLTVVEVYRINRIRLAEHFHIDPRIIDDWDTMTYYDALEVRAADLVQEKLNS